MNCAVCTHEMKPLFTSYYCPNEDSHIYEVSLTQQGDEPVWTWEGDGVHLKMIPDTLFGKKYTLFLFFSVVYARVSGDTVEEINNGMQELKRGNACSLDHIDVGLIPEKIRVEVW